MLKWTDTEDIAEILDRTYPDQEVMSLRFTDLYNKVVLIEDFSDDHNRSNEKILEAIQAEWYNLKHG